jgi:hypothetical protein
MTTLLFSAAVKAALSFDLHGEIFAAVEVTAKFRAGNNA